MKTVAVIGLGYVGLPLAIAFGKKFPTIGFDINPERIRRCRQGDGIDLDITPDDFKQARLLEITDDPAALKRADYVVIAVPTPVDGAHRPDFGPLISASTLVGKHLKKNAIVIYESTVYPGATEEVCVPVLESHSGMKWREGFNVGYSPERINPGDKKHTLENIVKVVSGDCAATLNKVAELYASVITAGVCRASSIKAAEAAKVIENTQRDLNIALMNELAMVFNIMGIDTVEVLEAAGTKWNFLPFRPGLVGGHCIGVDPYYLTHKAETLGYHPQVILAGRRINDGMGKFVAEQTVKKLIASGSAIRGAKVSVLGLSFKENCNDLRNTRVIDVINELRSYGIDVSVHDPVVDSGHARHEYGIELVSWDDLPVADAMVVAVAHDAFTAKDVSDYAGKIVSGGVFVDVKSAFDRGALKSAGLEVWRL
ncbi:MAG: UDP-N-acetyl-D-mannosaminuronate dehydrogenase [Gammaproteobacteria bacterium]|nr:MAG: UDP-N-acetyl-D-mannosaminuronate dehydrogenase [Gammaproteobacteria bacterium]TND07065.1 MAG: UDP-N-acetyl-D-mannosaminuronate dehydrogenase [Gammaproteobacteria bacterium]